jgi:hypothetical protein
VVETSISPTAEKRKINFQPIRVPEPFRIAESSHAKNGLAKSGSLVYLVSTVSIGNRAGT